MAPLKVAASSSCKNSNNKRTLILHLCSLTSNLNNGLKPSSQFTPLVTPSTICGDLIDIFYIHPVTCTQIRVAPVCTMYVRLSSHVDKVNISSRSPTFPVPITESLFGIACYNILFYKAHFLSFKTSHTQRWDDAEMRGNILPPLPPSKALSKGNATNIYHDNVVPQRSNNEKKKKNDNGRSIVSLYDCTRSGRRFLTLYRRQEWDKAKVLQGSLEMMTIAL